ncbi:MAG: hypothetical protein WAK50_12275 [Nitrososphaeraceae archaeon]
MVESKTSGTIRITFNSPEDKNNGFFELVQHSGSGFSGAGKNEYFISQDQGNMLRAKNINFTIVNTDSAKYQSRRSTA